MPRQQEWTDDPENNTTDGFPFGLTKPVLQLTPEEVEAVGRRHNMWTRTKMSRFLDALATSSSVTQAARSIGMSCQSAYRLRAPTLQPDVPHGLGSRVGI